MCKVASGQAFLSAYAVVALNELVEHMSWLKVLNDLQGIRRHIALARWYKGYGD